MVDTTGLTGTWTIDPTHTNIGFNARHAMVTKVKGNFDEFEGTITIAENANDSSVEATVQAASFNTNNKQRDEHVLTGDFLDTEKYSTMTFKSTSVEFTSDEEFKLTGDLTIKDVTKPVTFDVEYNGVAQDPFGNQRAGFEAKTSINRTEFGVTFNAALETGGVLVSEKVGIELEISAIKNA